jgi:uncharacterized membrane protein YecN with MAPEG domain
MTLPLQITALYASLFGVMFVMLMVVVIRLRRSLKIGLGDGGNRDMQQAIRVHGNAVECVPLFLILLAALEINHGSPIWLHLFGGTFLLARVLHAWGLYVSSGTSTGRVAGTAVTMTLLVALAIANLSKIF